MATFDQTAERKSPFAEGNFRLHAKIEHGKTRGEFLSGRKAFIRRVRARDDAARLLFFRPFLFCLDVPRLRHGREGDRRRRDSQAHGIAI